MKRLVMLLMLLGLALLVSRCTKPDNSNPCPDKDKLIEEQTFRITNLTSINDSLKNENGLLEQNITGLNLAIHILRDRLDNIVPDTVNIHDTLTVHDTTIIDNTISIANIDSIKFSKIDSVKNITYNVKAYLDKDSVLTSWYYVNDTLNLKMSNFIDGLKLFNHYKERFK